MKKIGILVDSSATCEPKIFDNTIIEWIPLHITYLDSVDILDTEAIVKKNQVLKRIHEGELWKTSQASPGELEHKYTDMLKQYEHIVHIPITENLSSMLSTAIMVSQDAKFIGKVTVVRNTAVAAQGIKVIALHLAQKIEKNELKTAKEVVAEFNKMRNKVYISIIPSDLKRLAGGGRAVKLIGTVLNIFKTKLLIRWLEKPEKEAIGRTISGLVERVIKDLNTEFGEGGRNNLIITGLPHYSDKNIKMVTDILKENKIEYSFEPIPHLYPLHAGLETVGFIAWNFE